MAPEAQNNAADAIKEDCRFARIDLMVIATLAIIETLCFGTLVKKIGFYLDDWATFAQLHFAPHNFLDLLKASLADPRMITRPVQCLYYATTYMCFGDAPMGYHVVRCVIEFLGAAFLYRGLSRLTGRYTAAIAAFLFLVYPSHDSSHYWIGAGLGAGFGITLYLLSFWLLVRALTIDASRLHKVSYALSLAAFALCAYCYEAFLPMLAASGFAALYLLVKRGAKSSGLAKAPSLVSGLNKTFGLMMPFVIIGLTEPVYQRVIVPKLAKVFLSPSTFNPKYAMDVFSEGMNVSLGPSGWSFFLERATAALNGLSATQAVEAFGIFSVTTACLLFIRKMSKQNWDEFAAKKISPLPFIAATAIVMLCSYLTFAVAEGYTPTLYSMINRVNMGAATGASVIIAVLLAYLAGKTWRRAAAGATATGALVALMVLANWGCAPYWVQSWQVQSHIQKIVRDDAANLKDGNSLLLANTPRYVMWAPVYDGVWDFQSMVWITLNTRKISGGVVSERLDLHQDSLTDTSAGFLCARYPIEGLKLVVPNPPSVLEIKSPQDFLAKIREHGMSFGLSPIAVERWQKSL